jgi:hypothetical protein
MVQDKNAKNGKRSPSCDKNHISDHLILQMVIQQMLVVPGSPYER